MDRFDKIFYTIEGSLVLIIILSLTILPAYFSSTQNEFVNSMTNGFVRGNYNTETDEITIFIKNNTLTYKIIYAHEECHRTQNYEGREIFKNGKLKNRFLLELECYIKEWGVLFK